MTPFVRSAGNNTVPIVSQSQSSWKVNSIHNHTKELFAEQRVKYCFMLSPALCVLEPYPGTEK